MATNYVASFNAIADGVLDEFLGRKGGSRLNETLTIMDAYWLTFSRPDNRQVNKDNSIGAHLVHGGEEVNRCVPNR